MKNVKKKRNAQRRLNDGTSVRGNTGPEVSALLSDGSSDRTSLHFSLGVDDDSRVVFKVEVHARFASPSLALANHHGGHHFLPELGLSLLHRAHHHIANTSSGKPVKAALDAFDSDDVKVLSTAVVSAVHERRNGKTERHLVLVAGSTTASTFRGHFYLKIEENFAD